MRKQGVIAICGLKNAGKTTLIESLLPLLRQRGIRVATVKHDGHVFSPDRPGTDSYRHLASGAVGAAVFDGEKYQLVRYASVTERDLIACFPEADLILMEGLKHSAWPKIEVVRRGISDRPLCPEQDLLAVVTDLEDLHCSAPVFSFRDLDALADRILTSLEKRA